MTCPDCGAEMLETNLLQRHDGEEYDVYRCPECDTVQDTLEAAQAARREHQERRELWLQERSR